MKKEGVVQIQVESFERVNKQNEKESDEGVIAVGLCEVIRLDNNPLSPENGTIEFYHAKTEIESFRKKAGIFKGEIS